MSEKIFQDAWCLLADSNTKPLKEKQGSNVDKLINLPTIKNPQQRNHLALSIGRAKWCDVSGPIANHLNGWSTLEINIKKPYKVGPKILVFIANYIPVDSLLIPATIWSTSLVPSRSFKLTEEVEPISLQFSGFVLQTSWGPPRSLFGFEGSEEFPMLEASDSPYWSFCSLSICSRLIFALI